MPTQPALLSPVTKIHFMAAVKSIYTPLFRYHSLATAITLCAGISPAMANDYQAWDWLPEHELSDQQRCQMSTGCQGAYVEPKADWPEAHIPPEQAALHAGANQSSMTENTVELNGDVILSKGQRRVIADSATLNRLSNVLKLKGHVEVREPGFLLRCEAGEINTDTGLGSFSQAHILNHDTGLRISAEQAEHPSEFSFNFSGARYTQCTPDDEVWVMTAGQLNLDQATGWGSAEDVVVRVKDIPVFYSPYLTFPIDDRRKTGFLWPTIASSDGGLDLSLPYYLNIAPNFDATITPRRVGQHGNMLEAETRYLNQYSFWTVAGAQLNDDEMDGEKRWLGNIKEQGRFGQHWSHSIDYNKVSDLDYLRDFSFDSISTQRSNHLAQTGRMSFNSQNWSGQVLVQEHQSLDTVYNAPYKRLPQISLSRQSHGENFVPDYSLSLQFTEFDHEESKEKGGSFDSGQRRYAEAGVSFPMRWAPGFIIPSTKVRHVSYQLDGLQASEDDSPEATVALGSLDMGLIFERPFSLSDSRYSQTLEPRVYHLYSDYEEQNQQPDFDSKALNFSYNQLFRDSRFTGHDRLDDANQTSVGVTSRFIDEATGLETLTLSLGQTFYWQDRRIQEDLSDSPLSQDNSQIAAEIRYQPQDNFWLNSTSLWDSRQDKMDEFGFSSHYKNDKALLNVGYRFRRDDPATSSVEALEQADISTVIALNDRWQAMARFQYDVAEDRSLEDLFGIEYQDCCWLTRIVYQRAVKKVNASSSLDTEHDHKIVLQFQLKGLGGIGNKAIRLLQESILGYEERD
ncbi:LPS-assembly protein LptD [Dasania sp. GY-MA-18]|uniref:LPS-assembly protein LptD n=1 Tax=Dasania phycosphaerae TaxID=2950436 RepID=A0A9J6RL63_9GAMM|nr:MULTISPECIES: LPS-assembly protein LptD [Dasania]MCR8922313.1 LPS-assembly protein LptD [Dasania sp. GY-MA-18]MCZ0864741.1 LPS-assembly protein LptD [Dasania phycosphaerae]MCZ0868469.1 LPS-assembly protein LptD [Dasania phycosphaerae]